MIDNIKKHLARAANQLNAWEYPPIFSIQAPVYWESLTPRQMYEYPPHTVYIWFIKLFSTRKLRSKVHLTENRGKSEVEAEAWWAENQRLDDELREYLKLMEAESP